MKARKALRVQWALIFVFLMSVCILACTIVSNALLRKYYHDRQIDNIENVYNRINNYSEWKSDSTTYSAKKNWPGRREIFEEFWETFFFPSDSSTSVEQKLSKELEVKLDRLSSMNNVTICIIDTKNKKSISPIYTSTGDGYSINEIVESIVSYVKEDSDINSSSSKIIKDGQAYTMYRSHDSHTDLVNYDLVGLLDSKQLIFIRKNYESIDTAAAVATNFFGYVGLFMIFIEAIIVVVLLRRFSRPIVRMNDVAKRMADLDFEARAEATQNNEIGELADSLNTLSGKLEKTIIELKSANHELRQDILRRDEIDEMRQEFLGNVSHELKTPIAIIQGYAEGIKDNVADDSESRDYYCDVIIDEATRMNTLVLKLISLTRIESGQSQLELSRFDVVEIIRGILSSSEIMAGDRAVTSVFDEDKPCYVYADEFMIEECVSNYISNAYHHVNDGGEIRVTLTRHDDFVRLAVYNSGSHIPEEDLDKVWIKFFKVDKARTREYGGSGIGLSIVKAIANLHGRECGVNNIADGVEFYIDIDINPNNG